MKFLTRILLAVGAFGFALAAGAADDQTFNQEMLDALRDEGAISQSRYEELSRKARQHEAVQMKQQPPAVSAPANDPEGWKVGWKNSTSIQRNDGRYEIKLGGRINLDAAAIGASDAVDEMFAVSGTGAEFRRARLFVSGTLFENLLFKAQYDFADSDTTKFKDVYIGYQNIPYLGTLLIGHFKESFSLEEMTSSKFIRFMERALPVEAFSPSRNTGFAFSNTAFDERMFWNVGAYRDVDDSGSGFSNDAMYNITTRVTGLPYYEEDGRRLVHLGMSYSHKFRSDAVGFDTPPEAHLSNELLDTGDIPTDGVDLLALEFATVLGPVSFQGEWINSWVDQRGGPDVRLWGAYAEASWFLTGEHRGYRKSRGSFYRIKLNETFSPFERGTWGAFEVAGRYSYLDLSDRNVRGGTENNYSLALSWWLFSNFRITTNWVRAHLNGVGREDIAQIRFGLEF